MSFRIGRETLQQFEALLATLMGTDTSMRLIDNYEPWADSRESLASPISLNVVETHDCIRVSIEQSL